jgi:hypothetical protein
MVAALAIALASCDDDLDSSLLLPDFASSPDMTDASAGEVD